MIGYFDVKYSPYRESERVDFIGVERIFVVDFGLRG
jgi:hypothetical protein